MADLYVLCAECLEDTEVSNDFEPYERFKVEVGDVGCGNCDSNMFRIMKSNWILIKRSQRFSKPKRRDPYTLLEKLVAIWALTAFAFALVLVGFFLGQAGGSDSNQLSSIKPSDDNTSLDDSKTTVAPEGSCNWDCGSGGILWNEESNSPSETDLNPLNGSDEDFDAVDFGSRDKNDAIAAEIRRPLVDESVDRCRLRAYLPLFASLVITLYCVLIDFYV